MPFEEVSVVDFENCCEKLISSENVNTANPRESHFFSEILDQYSTNLISQDNKKSQDCTEKNKRPNAGTVEFSYFSKRAS